MPRAAARSDPHADRPLSVREAAIVAGVAHRRVHRMIDDDLLPRAALVRGGPERRLRPAACAMIRFEAVNGAALTKGLRRRVMRALLEAGAGTDAADGATVFAEGDVTVDLSRALRETARGLEALRCAEAEVVDDPGVRGGLPVLRGTRIGVHEAAGLARSGGVEEALAAYPSLTRERVEAALLYAEAHPRPGRPRRPGPPAPVAAARSSTRMSAAELG